MAAIDFPSAPTGGQRFTAANGITYVWNGTLWTTPNGASPSFVSETYDMRNDAVFGAGTFPMDDTIPQITEGQRLFQRTFTAVDASHPIEVDADAVIGAGGAGINAILALFIDDAPDAVAVKIVNQGTVQAMLTVRLRWRGVLGAGLHTFEVRWGSNPGGSYLARNDTSRYLGGSLQATMSVREIGVGPVGPAGPAGAGQYVIQSKLTQLSTPLSSAAIIPLDNTIPQRTEGTQMMTNSITPTNVNNRIRATAKLRGYCSVSATFMASMIRDNVNNAVVAGFCYSPGSNQMHTVELVHEQVAGQLTSMAFAVRFGPDRAATAWVNAFSDAATLGGVTRQTLLLEELGP